MKNLLHGLLINSAHVSPDRAAVIDQERSISYSQLNLLSDQWALALFHNGVKRGDRVGILLDKSIEAVAAIFAVLKTGAAYVPLGPLDPPLRHLNIIHDCGIEHLISSAKKGPWLEEIFQSKCSLSHVYIIDAQSKKYKGLSSTVNLIFQDDILSIDKGRYSLKRKGNGKDLAYVLYTSGSTGKPKGVMVTHEASLAFINWATKYFKMRAHDIVSSHAQFNFDLSIFDIFVTIKAGARMCLVPQGISIFPKDLTKFIAQEKISIWYSVPSVLTQPALCKFLKNYRLPHLKKILFAGEVFPTKHLRRMMKVLPGCRFFNLYGPTETNVCACYPVLSIPRFDKPIPIGKPCAGARCFVSDEAGGVVKNNKIGELCVNTPALMRGYWNDAPGTEKAFVRGKGKKYYKTGDFVSIRGDGNIEFHGRRDSLIKRNGYRIELDEMECALASHPLVHEAAVVAISKKEEAQKLKAMIVLNPGAALSENQIKLFCSKKLPSYMVPDEIIFKEMLPRTSNNKVDKVMLGT